MGDGTYLVARIETISAMDFRVGDQTLSLQGAPLIAIFDALVLRHSTKLKGCRNIDSITNVSTIPPDNCDWVDDYYEFDTKPGNIVADAWL